jgi:hypothetical protein
MPAQLRLMVCLVALAAASCTGVEDASDTTVPGDVGPTQVVSALLAAIEDGRFEDAAGLTDHGQAALLTLVEGANASEVAGALIDEPLSVTSNFWSGFAQTLHVSLSPGDVTVTEGQVATQGDSQFVTVLVQPDDDDERAFVLRRKEDAWVIDLFATFGPAMSEKLLVPVETILNSAHADAALVRTRLSQTADSLLVAASDPTLPTASHQSLLALIERVTRTPG